jgi:hypothetical protein
MLHSVGITHSKDVKHMYSVFFIYCLELNTSLTASFAFSTYGDCSKVISFTKLAMKVEFK